MKDSKIITNDVNDILFPVEKVDFQEKFGVPTNSEYSHAIIGNIGGEEKVLNVCSKRYELVPNQEIFPLILDELKNHGITNFSQSYENYHNAKFYGDYTLHDYGYKVTDGDVVEPVIKVQHSYNGLNKYKIHFGYFRFICENGLVIPVEEKKDLNISIQGKHTEQIRQSIGLLFDKLQLFFDNRDLFQKNMSKLADTWVENWGERLEVVLNATGQKPSKDQFANIEATIRTESAKLASVCKLYKGGKVNDWLIYNGINEYIYNDDYNKKHPEVRQKEDQKVINFVLAGN